MSRGHCALSLALGTGDPSLLPPLFPLTNQTVGVANVLEEVGGWSCQEAHQLEGKEGVLEPCAGITPHHHPSLA